METTRDTNNTDQPWGSPPPPPRLTRSTDDKVVAGLCGGLGRHFGVDPVVFRIAFVVLTLAGGSGALAYLVGWLMIPDDRGVTVMAPPTDGRFRKLLPALLVGLGAVAVAGAIFDDHDGGVPVALVLLGVGAAVLWSRGNGGNRRPPDPPGTEGGGPRAGAAPTAPAVPPTPPGPEGPATPPDPEGSATPGATPDPEAPATLGETPTRPLAGLADTMAFGPPPAPPGPGAVAVRPAPAVPRPPRPRSVLVPVTLSLLALLAGTLALLDVTGVVSVSMATGFALALLLTGVAMVVGAWRGRARWLIPVGLVLAAGLAVTSLIDVPVRGGTGDRLFRPETAAQVESPYRLAAGRLVLDLAALDLGGEPVTVVASVAAGDLEVVVPDAVNLDVDAHVGAGNLELFERAWSGVDVDRQQHVSGDEGGGRLLLRVRVGVGNVRVRHASA